MRHVRILLTYKTEKRKGLRALDGEAYKAMEERLRQN
jgi:hypothetical protein